MRPRLLAVTALAWAGSAGSAPLCPRPSPLDAQWRGSVGLEAQAHPPAWTDVPGLALLMTGRGTVDLWGAAAWLAVEPYLLLDLTGSRTLFDLPELSSTLRRGSWQLMVGNRVVSWGVVESTQAGDVINQRLPLHSALGYRKLGQPMLTTSWLTGAGNLEAYILPGFRQRRVSDPAARIWSRRPVDPARSTREARRGRHLVDWALRWSFSGGAWDVAASHFSGRSREPLFDLAPGTLTSEPADGAPWLIPSYPLIDQTAMEAQWTRGSWLLKLEGITRSGAPGRHQAVTGGVEYMPTDYLAFFVEYAYDSRGREATTSWEHDAYLGGRLLTDRGTMEAGLFVDTASGNRVARAAGRRRLGSHLVLSLEARGFWGDANREPPMALRRGAFISTGLTVDF